MDTNCELNPKSLRTLATNVKFPCGNTMLHQFVLDISHPNKLGSAGYMNAVLISMRGAPSNFVNALNNGGKSALDLAVMRNNPLMVGKLLSCLPNINVNARCRRKRSRLVEGDTPLHLAADLGYLSVVRELLDHGAATDMRNENLETALCYAARSGHLEVMKFLMSKGAKVNPVGALMSPLCHAVNSGDWRAVEFLVTSGADVMPALDLAVIKNNPLMVGKLLSRLPNIDVNAICWRKRSRPIKGETNLHLAADFGYLSVVRELLDHGAATETKNVYRETALCHAARSGHLEVMKMLVSKGAKVNPIGPRMSPLCHAVNSGNWQAVEFLMTTGANVNPREGWLPLCCAVRSGQLAIAELLVNSGADVNAKEHSVELYRHLDPSMLTLLGETAIVNPRNRRVCTALHLAAYYGCLKTVEYLVGNGANVDARDEWDETPLDYATFVKREDCASFLKRCYAEDWSFHSRANCKYRYFWCTYCQSDV